MEIDFESNICPGWKRNVAVKVNFDYEVSINLFKWANNLYLKQNLMDLMFKNIRISTCIAINFKNNFKNIFSRTKKNKHFSQNLT